MSYSTQVLASEAELGSRRRLLMVRGIALQADSEIATLRASLAEAQAQRDALRADAERYRWLRANRLQPDAGSWFLSLLVYEEVDDGPAALDRAIDAARGATTPTADARAKRWPFASPPWMVARSLERAVAEFHGDMLAAVRNVFIEQGVEATPAPQPAGAAQTQFAWLVENGKQAGSGLAYRYMDQGLPLWTDDPHKAMRFARRVDAEMFAAEDEDAWRIVEHGFDETQPAGAAEQDRGIEDLLGALHRAEIEELLLPIQPPPTKERTECAGECGRSIPRGTEEGYGWPLIPMTRRYHCGSWECEQRVREQEK